MTDERKWRIKRRPEYARPWVVFAPGSCIRAWACFTTHDDATAALRAALRDRRRRRK